MGSATGIKANFHDRKKMSLNISETSVETFGQFHQNFMRKFFIRKYFFSPKSFCQSQKVTRENICKALSYKKRACKMMMKWTPCLRMQIEAPKCKFKEQHQFWSKNMNMSTDMRRVALSYFNMGSSINDVTVFWTFFDTPRVMLLVLCTP